MPFGPLDDLRARPIPDQRPLAAKKAGYRQHRLDLSDPRAREPLIEARAVGLRGRNHYASASNPPYWRRIAGAVDGLYLRRGVADRLLAIDERLKAGGLALHLFDAWRPRAVQAYFHTEWMPAELKRRNPGLTGPALAAMVETYWAAPTADPASPTPHSTGGAVDLTLVLAETGEALFMGSLFDDVSKVAEADYFERSLRGRTDLAFSDEEARANRRLLHWVMTEAGFAANPSEWWHFGYGDLMWARLTDAPASFYGAIDAL